MTDAAPATFPAPVAVPFPAPLVPARFIARPNRFIVHATLADEGAEAAVHPAESGEMVVAHPAGSGETVVAHLADPGRLRELLLPGRRLWLLPAANPQRRTRWSVVLAEMPDGTGFVSLDTTLPNRLVAAALRAEALPELAAWRFERAEARVDHGRVDFVLANEDGERLALEVKSVTLVVDGVAKFPDAVTARGTRHMRGLAALAQTPGWHAAVLFVAQRADVAAVTAAPEIDPAFAAALAAARAAGVRVLARRCRVGLAGVGLAEVVPVVAQ